MKTPARVAVLISGRGSNLNALIDACSQPGFPAVIVCVISNRPDAEGLRRAEEANISSHVIQQGAYATRKEFERALEATLAEVKADLVCLAGFMRVLSPRFVENWTGRLVNIHPSLLPAFKGLNVHARVIAAGVRISGCTVHFVIPELDSGPIIAQAAVPVLPSDTEETLAARTLAAEHRLYPLAIRLLAERRVRLEDERVVYAGGVTATGELFNPSPVQI